ncbi:hypothetical protein BC351_25090 [Paenibacillus ferrarius]|uniref:Uncharacterized protein n=1 Tax=Paenibacillus ferrarius TaxID=1469647 RepID=A0A1V4HJ65_9BACL|nr:hypothetical protein BC351_25090 [Paenibacillus ferrarius]
MLCTSFSLFSLGYAEIKRLEVYSFRQEATVFLGTSTICLLASYNLRILVRRKGMTLWRLAALGRIEEYRLQYLKHYNKSVGSKAL